MPNLHTLGEELNLCDGEIEQIHQRGPDRVLAHLRQGGRATEDELKNLQTYLKSYHRLRAVARKVATQLCEFTVASPTSP